MSAPDPTTWAKLGPLYVTQAAAEQAAASGQAVRIYPDGMEALGEYISLPGQMGDKPRRANLSWTLPIIRSHWKIEPGGDDRQALEEAEFIRANLFEYLQGGFYQFVEQAVASVWRGFSLFEIVARFDRDSKQTRLDQLSPMLPNTVYSWNRYESGRWGVTQEPYQGEAASHRLGSERRQPRGHEHPSPLLCGLEVSPPDAEARGNRL